MRFARRFEGVSSGVRAESRSDERASERIMQPPRQMERIEGKDRDQRKWAEAAERRCRPWAKEERKEA